MATVKAPYNFVPLPEDVFFPSWAEQISQDLPFSNGLSGTIDVTITAKTPIFVHNGYSGGAKDNAFCHTPDGRFFIPATTVKSCIRSVLEIMSFCKMKPATKEIKGYRKSPDSMEKDRQVRSANKQQKPGVQNDLAECILGFTSDDESLRGRVQFTNFICTNPVNMPSEKNRMIYVLNSPNPACKPTYVKGNGMQYFDYDSGRDAKDIMNGWKRYVLKDRADFKDKGKESNTTSTIMPLNKGTEFRGTIRFHNLLPQELGALLCALMWNNESGCYHQIGQAKPYGYGRVSFGIDDITKQSAPQYIQSYKKMMKDWLTKLEEEETTWRNTKNIDELFTLASYKAEVGDRQFQYMRSDALKEAKNNHESLPLLSDILKEREEVPFKPTGKEVNKATEIIDNEKWSRNIYDAKQISERTDLLGKEGLIIIAEAIDKLDQLPDLLKSKEETKLIYSMLRKYEKDIRKEVLRLEKKASQDSQNELEPIKSEEGTSDKVKPQGSLLAKISYFDKRTKWAILEEGKDKGKKELVVEVNANTKNKIKSLGKDVLIYVKFSNDKKKLIFIDLA